MVTGRPAFAGSSPASLIAVILTSEPPAAPPLDLPPTPLGHVVRTCLVKDPAERRQTAHDLLLELQWIAAHPSSSPTTEPRVSRGTGWRWTAALGALIVAAGTTAYSNGQSTTPSERRNSSSGGVHPFLRCHPTGTRIASPRKALPAGGCCGFALSRRPQQSQSQAPRTQASVAGRQTAVSLGFFASGNLKIVSSSAPPHQPSRTLAAAPEPRGRIPRVRETVDRVRRNLEGRVLRVSAPAGRSEVTPVTTTRPGTPRKLDHRWPQFLPDGKRICVSGSQRGGGSPSGSSGGTPEANDWKLLLRTPANALVTRGTRRSWLPALTPAAGLPFLFFTCAARRWPRSASTSIESS